MPPSPNGGGGAFVVSGVGRSPGGSASRRAPGRGRGPGDRPGRRRRRRRPGGSRWAVCPSRSGRSPGDRVVHAPCGDLQAHADCPYPARLVRHMFGGPGGRKESSAGAGAPLVTQPQLVESRHGRLRIMARDSTMAADCRSLCFVDPPCHSTCRVCQSRGCM